MALGTLDRTPPPFFRQGTSALTKLWFFSALALLLMVADARFKMLLPARVAVATVLYPVQRVLLVPVEAIAGGRDYLAGLTDAVSSERAARRQLAEQSERALRVDQLMKENSRLRGLLALGPTLSVNGQAAELLYEAADPYSRKVVINRGLSSDIAPGSPVINEAGVLGQVTRVYLQSSEVTLLIDHDAAIPVLDVRTGKRSVAYGSTVAGAGLLEMRYVASNTDVEVGDVLTTSGLDGIYPAGLPVAKVTSVERKADTGFARIVLAPTASPDGVRHVLVLEPVGRQTLLSADASASAAAFAPKPAAAASKAAPKPDSKPEDKVEPAPLAGPAAKAIAGPGAKPASRPASRPASKPPAKPAARSPVAAVAKPPVRAAARPAVATTPTSAPKGGSTKPAGQRAGRR